jgi:hypothetical protein
MPFFFKGERFDFILNANQDIKNYWIRVKGFLHCRNVYQTAILNYEEELPSSIPVALPFNYSTMDRLGLVRKY